MKYLSISTRLGDPHHDPYAEDPQGTRLRLSEALGMLYRYAPGGVIEATDDEDGVLWTAITDEAFEAFKQREGGDPQDDLWYWEGEKTLGHYQLSADIADEPPYDYSRRLVPDTTGLVSVQTVLDWWYSAK